MFLCFSLQLHAFHKKLFEILPLHLIKYNYFNVCNHKYASLCPPNKLCENIESKSMNVITVILCKLYY